MRLLEGSVRPGHTMTVDANGTGALVFNGA